MRLFVLAIVLVLAFALGALEIFAARGVSDADVPGGATSRVTPAVTEEGISPLP